MKIEQGTKTILAIKNRKSGEIWHPDCLKEFNRTIEEDKDYKGGDVYIHDLRSEHVGRFECCSICQRGF